MSTLGFRQWSLREALMEIAAAGVRWADIGGIPGYCTHFVPDPEGGELERWGDEIASAGVRVHTLNVSCGAFNDEREDVAAVRRRARYCLAAAAKVGAHGVTFAPGAAIDRTARSLAAEIARVATEWRALAQEAEALGLVISFEAPHNRSLILNAIEAGELMQAIDHPRARLVFDVGHHCRSGIALPEAWRTVSRWIDYVHLKDQASGRGCYPLGAGEIDWRSFFTQAAGDGYTGRFSFEFPDAVDSLAGMRALIEQSHQFVAPFLFPSSPCPEKSG